MSECTRSCELQTVGLRNAVAQNPEVKMQLYKFYTINVIENKVRLIKQ